MAAARAAAPAAKQITEVVHDSDRSDEEEEGAFENQARSGPIYYVIAEPADHAAAGHAHAAWRAAPRHLHELLALGDDVTLCKVTLHLDHKVGDGR